MTIEVQPVRGKKATRDFLNLPFELYKFDHNWTAPLMMEQRSIISKKKNPWFEHGEAEFFIAYNNRKPVGRISAQIDKLHLKRHDNTGFFGFFECENELSVAKKLLQAAEKWLVGRKVDAIRGPFTMNINGVAGFLIDGWHKPPMIEMAHNPPYYNDLVKKCGYEKAKDLYAWNYDILKPIPEMAVPVAEMVREYPGLVLRPFNKKEFDRDLQIVLSVFNEAWERNWGYIPMTDAEIEKMSKDLKMIIQPEVVLIAEVDGDPAGICLCLPNLNEAIYGLNGRLVPFGIARLLYRLKFKGLKTIRLTLLGIRKKYRGSVLGGLSVLLYHDIHRITKDLGYEFGELSWTLEDNVKINKGIEFMGGTVYKTYRVYEKKLTTDGKKA